MSVTLLIVDLCQSCVCFIRSCVTRCTLLMVLYLDHMCHRYTYAPLRCRTSQYSRTFILISVSFCNDLAYPVFVGVGLAGFKSRANVVSIGLSCSIPTILFYSFSLSLFLSIGWYCGAGVFGLIGCISLSLSLALPTFLSNNNN